MNRPLCVLAFSGGLDAIVCVRRLHDAGYDVFCVAVDAGGLGTTSEEIERRALACGAVGFTTVSVVERFARECIVPAIWANTIHEGSQMLGMALGAPVFAEAIVLEAEKRGARYIAHGGTGKGNWQVRFELMVAGLNPDLRILAPIRDWACSREEEMLYAEQHSLPVPPEARKSYMSSDHTLYCRMASSADLDNLDQEPSEELYEWTASVENTPKAATYVEIGFVDGVPTTLDGEELCLVDLLEKLNIIAGRNGVGRSDIVKNRIVGIKAREVHETPAGTVLMAAHRELEQLTKPLELLRFKQVIDREFARVVYDGLWFNPLRDAVNEFLRQANLGVSGMIRMKLNRGHLIVAGRTSEMSLYDAGITGFGHATTFDDQSVTGFLRTLATSTRMYRQKNPIMGWRKEIG